MKRSSFGTKLGLVTYMAICKRHVKTGRYSLFGSGSAGNCEKGGNQQAAGNVGVRVSLVHGLFVTWWSN